MNSPGMLLGTANHAASLGLIGPKTGCASIAWTQGLPSDFLPLG